MSPPTPEEARAAVKAQKAFEKANRPWYKKKRFIIPLVLLFLIIIVVDSGGSGSEGPAQTTATQSVAPSKSASPVNVIGVPVAAGDLQYTVTNATTKSKLENSSGSKDGNWVLVDVTVVNNGKDQVTISDSDFTLVDSEGNRYGTDSDGLRYLDSDKDFFLEDLNPKLSISGQVLFAVPAGFDVTKASLQARDGFGPKATVQLHK